MTGLATSPLAGFDVEATPSRALEMPSSAPAMPLAGDVPAPPVDLSSPDDADAAHDEEWKPPQETVPARLSILLRPTLVRRLELPLTLAGCVLPALALWALQQRALFSGAFNETLVALMLAATISWYVLARLRDYAKARHLSYVLPVTFLAFSSVLGALALLRLPYSASLFAAGAASTLFTSFLIAVRSRGVMKPHFIVTGGRASEIQLTGAYLPAPALDDLEKLVASRRSGWSIVADLHYPHSGPWERLFAKAALAGIPVYHYRQIAEMQTGQVKINHLSENDLGSLVPNVSYLALKRLVDVIGALVLLLLCLPAFVLIATLIRIDSPGSSFFIQERVGFRGETFRMIKFRTMRARDPAADSQAAREDAMTHPDDDRITRIGAFLRKTRIDELPQIFNILKGEMSFIGPRPEARSLSEWYEEELPFYSYRHIVRPGITGWAQVNQGHVTDVSDVLGKLRFDFYYIKNISLWLDLLVALKTIRVIVTGIGAK